MVENQKLLERLINISVELPWRAAQVLCATDGTLKRTRNAFDKVNKALLEFLFSDIGAILPYTMGAGGWLDRLSCSSTYIIFCFIIYWAESGFQGTWRQQYFEVLFYLLQDTHFFLEELL